MNRCFGCCLLENVSIYDSSLVSFYSEIRLVEIVEGLCDSSSFECNHMVEEHEEHFETWWFKRCDTYRACSGRTVVAAGWDHTHVTDRNHNICCLGAGKQNIRICTSGSASRPSKSAVRKGRLGGTATVSVALMLTVDHRGGSLLDSCPEMSVYGNVLVWLPS